jgi:hypothetical protein
MRGKYFTEDGVNVVMLARLGDGSRRRVSTGSTPTPRDAAGPGDPAAALPLELHGSLWRVRFTTCSARVDHVRPVDAGSTDALPRCDHCSARLRPDVVWFCEPLTRRRSPRRSVRLRRRTCAS